MNRATHQCIITIPRKTKYTGIKIMTTTTKEPNLTNIREDKNSKQQKMYMRDSLKNQEKEAKFLIGQKTKGFMKNQIMALKIRTTKKSVK